MADTLAPTRAERTARAARSKRAARAERAIITVIAFAGVSVLLFPTIANWFSSLGFHEQKGAYDSAVDKLSEEQKERIIQDARRYNDDLPGGPLRDPYMLGSGGEVVDLRNDLPRYEKELDFGDGLMGWVEIPSIQASLPIYHGTDPAILDKGAGHLHGSALPVGGPGSHAVLTAHSGRVEAKLFTDLDKVKKGDVFFTEIVGERFYYRVDDIQIVDPVYSGEKLRQVPGKDYVTLVTCTPTGVNSHRLLVRGVRIPGPPAAKDGAAVRAADYTPDFPWWTLWILGVPAATWVVLGAADRRRRRRQQQEFPESNEGRGAQV